MTTTAIKPCDAKLKKFFFQIKLSVESEFLKISSRLE